jgi:hypothetical protein
MLPIRAHCRRDVQKRTMTFTVDIPGTATIGFGECAAVVEPAITYL